MLLGSENWLCSGVSGLLWLSVSVFLWVLIIMM